QRKLVVVLDEPHCVEHRANVDDLFGRRDAETHAASHLIQQLGDLTIPVAEKAERREQGRTIGGNIRQLRLELAYRMCFVEAEYLLRRVGSVAEAVPYLALFVLVAAEQQLTIAVGSGDQCDNGFRLRKSRQVIKITVVPKRKQRVAIARDL